MKRIPIILAVLAIITIVCLSIVISANWFTSRHSLTGNFMLAQNTLMATAQMKLKPWWIKLKVTLICLCLGSSDLSFNESALTESCDYIANAGMHFIIMFTDITKYTYNTSIWTRMPKQNMAAYFWEFTVMMNLAESSWTSLQDKNYLHNGLAGKQLL